MSLPEDDKKTLSESLEELDRVITIYTHRSNRFRKKCNLIAEDIGEFNEYIRKTIGPPKDC
jgi:hypothetical protein